MSRQGLNGHIRFRHIRESALERALAALAKAGDIFFPIISDHLDRLTEEEQRTVLLRYSLLMKRRQRATRATRS